MKYLILNNINGNIEQLNTVLDLQEDYDKTLILGNIIGTKKQDSRKVLEILFKMITSKMCENFVCGVNDLNINDSKLPNGAKQWVRTFLPITSFKIENKDILLLTGTPDNPYNGNNVIDNNKYWNNDKDLDIIILGNNGSHNLVEKETQLIIYPGDLWDKNVIKYSILSITENNIKCEFKGVK